MGLNLGLQDESARNRRNYHAITDVLQELKGLGCIHINRLKHSGYYMYCSETCEVGHTSNWPPFS
jgi:hypothetical protein